MTSLNALYYVLKPVLPLRMRYAIRRLRAYYKLLATKDWPILESAGQKPPGWRGWPDKKQFAVVLTHDVEGQIGLDRTVRLAELEARHGFRSAFNFIPLGEYSVSPEIRDYLAAGGFEVGVHDLRHDGSLYRSHRHFRNAVPQVNGFLQQWGAVGFRAGFMFHNLEWLKELNIEYDASTFDTDPFEPQPEGVGTIFPFWVSRGKPGAGYMELPYTLPQDSTMFLIFREKAIDVWKQKLDWIAASGGMALLNVHPDYVAFDARGRGVSEFDPRIYEDFLEYVRQRYAGAYWHALPRDVARYCRSRLL
jgi:hypothetical protein